MGVEEYVVLVLVVGARLLLPLLIPYFPVPALLACLVLDSADQTIFQQFPAIDLEGYQSYDKALDIFYLSVAYLSVLRNWTNLPAVLMAVFLFHYRLIGALLFELTQERWLLFIFPNTFEYFFLFLSAIYLLWDQQRVSRKFVVWSTVFIWVVIKLPQEWWIHIAQLDFTEFMADHAWLWIPIAVIAAAVILGAWWWATRRAPAPDHAFSLRAAPLPAELTGRELYRVARAEERVFDRALALKAVLVALVVVIFSQFLAPNASPLQTALSVTTFVVLNTFVSQLLARRGRSWRSVFTEFVSMLVVNMAMAALITGVERWIGLRETRVPFLLLLFLMFIITVLVVLFDRYHTIFRARGILERRLAERRSKKAEGGGGSAEAVTDGAGPQG